MARPDRFPYEYHSEERVRFVNMSPCVVPGCERRPSENHHTGSDGIALKGHYTTICPLCHHHHLECHTAGKKTFQRRHGLDFVQEAYETESRWRAYVETETEDFI